MSENSAISWTDHTFNGWTGCTKVSPGCANCYAEGWAKRSGIVQWGAGKPRRRTSASNWNLPIKWNKAAEESGTRPRVFCSSLADWLDDEVPASWLFDLISLIHRTPCLDWLLLTKRPENWSSRLKSAADQCTVDPNDITDRIYAWLEGSRIWHNIWIGTTVDDHQRAEERIPELLKIPAKVRFLSCEPLLEAVDVSKWLWTKERHQYCDFCKDPAETPCDEGPCPWRSIHWVITGGESGPGFRTFDPEWARSLRDQCKAAGVAFHMKQMGGLKPSMMPPIPDDLMIREWPKGGVL